MTFTNLKIEKLKFYRNIIFKYLVKLMFLELIEKSIKFMLRAIYEYRQQIFSVSIFVFTTTTRDLRLK